MSGTRSAAPALLLLVLVSAAGAQANSRPTRPAVTAPVPPAAPAPLPIITSIRDLTPREHRAQGFVLPASTAIVIDAMGAQPSPGGSGAWPAMAWILDARTRQVAWNLVSAAAPLESNGLRHFRGTVTLPAGTYELHYASYPATSITTGAASVVQDIKTIIGQDKSNDRVRYRGPYVDDGLYRQFGITLRGNGRLAGFAELATARSSDASIVTTIHPVRHDAVLRQGFTLNRPTTLDLTAIGEMTSSRASDLGWIISATTHQDVWRMHYKGSTPAGGASRNRMTHDSLTLPAGTYVAYFTTSDDHDPSEWTHQPPYDPEGWGLVLRIANPAARAAFHAIDWTPVPATGLLASLAKVGDDADKTVDFTLAKPTNAQLYAVGEASGHEMVDYAWLMDMDRHVRVWTMKEAETIWAGGATKNRAFSGVLALPAGHYQLHYVSDGSHAYGDWNDDEPTEGEYWGVSLWPASGPVAAAELVPVLPATRQPALAAIHHVGDNLNVQVGFTVAADARFRVYAVGEGSGSMNDYATIEDARTHRTVWVMKYGLTEPAGGAEKNRQFDGLVELKAGKYLLRWRSDASHSWGRWNTDAPDDQEGWGVAISRVTVGGH